MADEQPKDKEEPGLPKASPHIQDKSPSGTAAMHEFAAHQIREQQKWNKVEREKKAAEAKKAAEELQAKRKEAAEAAKS